MRAGGGALKKRRGEVIRHALKSVSNMEPNDGVKMMYAWFMHVEIPRDMLACEVVDESPLFFIPITWARSLCRQHDAEG